MSVELPLEVEGCRSVDFFARQRSTADFLAADFQRPVEPFWAVRPAEVAIIERKTPDIEGLFQDVFQSIADTFLGTRYQHEIVFRKTDSETIRFTGTAFFPLQHDIIFPDNESFAEKHGFPCRPFDQGRKFIN